MRKIIIVEGGNYCGKTTITNALKKILTNATVIEMHDFFFLHILREKNINDISKLFSKEAYDNLNTLDILKAEKYLDKRNDLIVRFLENAIYEDVIIERSFLTQMVYRHYLFNSFDQFFFKEIEKKMTELGAKLILTSATNEEIKNRISNESREIRMEKKVQYHVIEEESILKKNELYNLYFKKLNCINKYKIKANHSTSNSEKLINVLEAIIHG